MLELLLWTDSAPRILVGGTFVEWGIRRRLRECAKMREVNRVAKLGSNELHPEPPPPKKTMLFGSICVLFLEHSF